MHNPVVASGVSLSFSDVIFGGSLSTTGSIIFSADSGVPSSLVSDRNESISCSSYSLIEGMSCCSNKSGSVSDPSGIGSRSVSGSTNSMCGASVSPSFTHVISISTIGHLLRSRSCMSLG